MLWPWGEGQAPTINSASWRGCKTKRGNLSMSVMFPSRFFFILLFVAAALLSCLGYVEGKQPLPIDITASAVAGCCG